MAGLNKKSLLKTRCVTVSVAVVLLAVWLLHRPALCGLAGLLVTDTSADSDAIWIRSNDGVHGSGQNCYDLAAEWYRRGPARRIVLVAWHPQRVVELGIVPSFEALCRRELTRRHVPETAIAVIPGDACTSWQEVRAMDRWLAGQPDVRVTAIARRFDSRLLHAMFQAVDRRLSDQVGILALRERAFDETNWWQRRGGVKAVMFAAIDLSYVWCQGEGQSPGTPPSAESYESAYLHSLPEVAR